ncbi:hypothetical protein NUM3379_08580 [Kineococcus sp. NUM-3379]
MSLPRPWSPRGVRRRGRRALRRLHRVRGLLRGLLAPGALPAARWAWRSLARVRAELPAGGVRVRAPLPPALPASGRGGVEAALRLGRATCLQRSLVVQAWLLGQGEEHDTVVAVSTEGGFAAHAWVDGYDPDESGRYRELTRLPACP